MKTLRAEEATSNIAFPRTHEFHIYIFQHAIDLLVKYGICSFVSTITTLYMLSSKNLFSRKHS